MAPLTTLSAWDYVVVSAMLSTSAAIGVFFAFQSGRHRQSSDSYFLGNRSMSVFPVAVSLTVTFISAVTYLGTPAEVYIHGPKYGLLATVRVLVAILVMYGFIPVFHRLRITSVYEYLGRRFNGTTRYLILVVTTIGEFVFMGIAVYAPSLALSTATGLSLSFSILTIGLICTFYTTVGGIKAVIWTDVFQGAAMMLGALLMIIVGTVKLGGPAEGWRRAEAGERTQLVDFSIDPTTRLSFWSVYIGGSFYFLAVVGTKQCFVQRFLACSNVRDAQVAALTGLVGIGAFELLAVTVGMTIFAYYYVCDPLTSQEIQRPDQIVPYFMIDVFASSPGVPGLLISGAFCSSLSSMSSILNSSAAVIGQDIIKTIWPNISESRYSVTVKLISALLGILTIALAFLAVVLGDVIQSTISIIGLTSGATLGVFILGIFFPRANSVGANVGFVVGTSAGLFFYIGSKFYPPVVQRPPLSDEGCSLNVDNQTADSYSEGAMVSGMYSSSHPQPDEATQATDGNTIFALSFLYYTVATTVPCVIIGLVVSYMTSKLSHQSVDPSLLHPIVARGYIEHVSEVDDDRRTAEVRDSMVAFEMK